MATTIEAGYMARVCRGYLKTRQVVSSQNPDGDFIRRMAKIYAENDGVSESENVRRISTEAMTMEEYKEYISNKISQLPMDPSNMQDYISVQISDAGFEAMKQDSEYEQWVLDSVKSNFTFRDPWSGLCGGKYVILYFGETQEQSRGESWRAGFLNGRGDRIFQQKSKNGFWEQRAQRRKQLEEEYEELQKEREWNKDPETGLYCGATNVLKAFRPKTANGGEMGM